MKKLLYIFIIFFIMLMSWDVNKENMVFAASDSDVIPDEAIRLRIIANSDAPEDQWLKRQVRDVVVEKVDNWVISLGSIEQARNEIDKHLPEIKELVKETIKKNGFNYEANVELGIVPFPTKMYGEMVYPAGDYEALRITLGEGQGQNWWCVLFPPLCFVDMSNGDAVKAEPVTQTKTTVQEKKETQKEEVEVKFFLAEIFEKIVAFFS